MKRPEIFSASPDPRVRVKICGVTHPDDAALAVELGADALGLNFYPRSLRSLDLERDADFLRHLPPDVLRVAVVVNAAPEFIQRLIGEGIVDAVQLHGDEDEAFCSGLERDGVPFMKAIRVRTVADLAQPLRFGTDHLLLDAYRPDAYGGTGHAIDWKLAASFASEHPRTILSGGLHPGNVAEAIRRVRPFAIDVASGVEGAAGPRRKDGARLREFFAAIHAAQ